MSSGRRAGPIRRSFMCWRWGSGGPKAITGRWFEVLPSPRVHPGLADDGRCFGRGEILQQCPRGVGRAGSLVDRGGEHRHLLDIGRQRSEIIDALYGQELADLLEADLGI